MLAAWVVFLFGSFLVSVLAMTYIQVQAASRYGWRGLRQRPFLETYWRELSLVERGLLWPGLVAFALSLLAAAIWQIVVSVG
jgi:hypothetical protein